MKKQTHEIKKELFLALSNRSEEFDDENFFSLMESLASQVGNGDKEYEEEGVDLDEYYKNLPEDEIETGQNDQVNNSSYFYWLNSEELDEYIKNYKSKYICDTQDDEFKRYIKLNYEVLESNLQKKYNQLLKLKLSLQHELESDTSKNIVEKMLGVLIPTLQTICKLQSAMENTFTISSQKPKSIKSKKREIILISDEEENGGEEELLDNEGMSDDDIDTEDSMDDFIDYSEE